MCTTYNFTCLYIKLNPKFTLVLTLSAEYSWHADTVLMPDPQKLELLEALFKCGLNYLSKVLGWPWFIASLTLMVPGKEAKVVLLHSPGELVFFFFASYKSITLFSFFKSWSVSCFFLSLLLLIFLFLFFLLLLLLLFLFFLIDALFTQFQKLGIGLKSNIFYLCICMLDTGMWNHTCGNQRMTLGIRPCLPPCLISFFFVPVCVRHTVTISRPVSCLERLSFSSHLYIGSYDYKCMLLPLAFHDLQSWTQILTCIWQVVCSPNHLPSPRGACFIQ